MLETAKSIAYDAEGHITLIRETRRDADGWMTNVEKRVQTNENGDITAIHIVESARFLDPDLLARQRDVALARDAASSAHRRGSGAMKMTRDARGNYCTPSRRS